MQWTELFLPALYSATYQRLLGKFDTIPLRDTGFIMGGGTPSKHNQAFWNGEVPWVSPKAMKNWYIDDSEDHISAEALAQSAAKLIPAPAVLFVVRGMILARNVPIGVSTRPLTINQDMKAIIPRPDIDAEYLGSMMRGAEQILLGRVEVAGHGTRKLESEQWGSLPIPIPQTIVHQRQIIRELNKLQERARELQSFQAAIEDELFSFPPALLAKAFRGEL